MNTNRETELNDFRKLAQDLSSVIDSAKQVQKHMFFADDYRSIQKRVTSMEKWLLRIQDTVDSSKNDK